MKDTIISALTDGRLVLGNAAATATSPWWLPSLKQASAMSADWLPIVGVTLGVLQIIALIVRTFFRRD